MPKYYTKTVKTVDHIDQASEPFQHCISTSDGSRSGGSSAQAPKSDVREFGDLGSAELESKDFRTLSVFERSHPILHSFPYSCSYKRLILKGSRTRRIGTGIAVSESTISALEAYPVMLYQDLSFALRQLFRHRVYALTAILSMALGIGATAAVYSVLYGVLIDPYPYHDAERLAFITIQSKQGRGEIPFTLSELDQLRQTKSVEDALGQNDESMVATDGEIPQSVKVLEISGGGFQLLGAPPLIGRVFTASEAREGVAPPPVAVISYLFWRSHFASDPNVLGKILQLNQHKYTVIGVLGPRFTWHDSEVYLPMPTGMDPKRRFETLVRLRPGVATAAAASELTGIVEQIRHVEPQQLPKDGYTVRVETLNDWLLGQFKGTLLVLFAAVALLLLIGCGNVSILMLARGTARLQELATRLAMGAARLRIIRQLLTEAVMLAINGWCGWVSPWPMLRSILLLACCRNTPYRTRWSST